jgi:hypothetical protein
MSANLGRPHLSNFVLLKKLVLLSTDQFVSMPNVKLKQVTNRMKKGRKKTLTLFSVPKHFQQEFQSNSLLGKS